MKVFRSLHICASILAAAFVLGGCKKPPPPPTAWQSVPEVELDFLVVRLPEKRALPLIPKLRQPQQAAAAASETLKLVETGEAELLGWPFLVAKNEERGVVEQIEEFRYATEYDLPSDEKRRGTEQPEAAAKPAPDGEPTTTVEVVDAALPGDYETRNIGVTLQAEPFIAADGRTIELSVDARHSRLKGMRKSSVEGLAPGQKLVVEQPEFVTHHVVTEMTVQDGSYTLLGAFKAPDLPDQMELFILHTRLKRVPVSPPKNAP